MSKHPSSLPIRARSAPPAAPAAAGRAPVLRRRVRLIVALTIIYNLAEAAIAVIAGTLASSSALVAFGLDSSVEVLSAAAVAWQFSVPDHAVRERTAMRVIALSFFALAAYVTVEALRSMLDAGEASPSTVGIALAAVSVVVMPTLSWLERRTGRELGSASVVADSRQTLLCAWLSGVLLAGLLLNATLGWSWADPLAALVIAAVALREGREALHGAACCTPAGAMLSGTPQEAAACSCGDGCAGDCSATDRVEDPA